MRLPKPARTVLVPAMSETMMPFGGPAAQLVGSNQALVAVANNPATWFDRLDPAARPARALFGHPGFGQQTRLVHSQDAEPGITLLSVRSGQLRWHAADPPGASLQSGRPGEDASSAGPAAPSWVTHLVEETQRHQPGEQLLQRPITLRPSAILVLLTDGPTGPRVLLTKRAPDLSDYPDQLVFPGGVTEPLDGGPVDTALREAAEQVGLDPGTVQIIGSLPAFALPDSGYLVTPVLAWSARPGFTGPANLAEVATISEVALHELANRGAPARPRAPQDTEPDADPNPDLPKPDLTTLGRMTASVIDLLVAILTRAGHPQPAADIPSNAPLLPPRQQGLDRRHDASSPRSRDAKRADSAP